MNKMQRKLDGHVHNIANPISSLFVKSVKAKAIIIFISFARMHAHPIDIHSLFPSLPKQTETAN